MATPTYYLSAISLVLQYFQNMGLMNAGGTVYTYVGGSVGTLVTTYTDSTGLVANPNPMTLNSAGRPASASGAPVAFWVPGGTVVQLQVLDANGNRLVFLDNIPALNDPTNASSSLAALLASPASANITGFGPVAGADLVANAVKAYDVFASVRSANAPTPVSGQNLIIDVEGALAVGDGAGGTFYWSSTATGSDDGRLVIKPNATAAASPGRWLRYWGLGVSNSQVLGADVSTTTNTTLTTSGLALTLLSGATYLVQARLLLESPTGTGQGYKVGLTFPSGGAAGGVQLGGGVYTNNGTGAVAVGALGAAAVASSALSTTGDICNLDFIVQVTSTGALNVMFAQDASSANATTLKAGSSLIITRIA